MTDKDSNLQPKILLPEDLTSGAVNKETTDDITPLAVPGMTSFNGVTNYSTYLQGGVDQRTGTFSASIDLAILQSGNLSGAPYSLRMVYSPLNQADHGLGKGWSLEDSYVLKAHTPINGIRQYGIKLPTGEIYGGVFQYDRDNAKTVSMNIPDTHGVNTVYTRLYEPTVTPENFWPAAKLVILTDTPSNPINPIKEIMVVFMKDGTGLFYAGQSGVVNNLARYYLTAIVSPQGQATLFERYHDGRLIKVHGSAGSTVNIAYRTGGADITLYADSTTEKQTIKITTSNDLLTQVENTSLASVLKWQLSYATVSDNSDKSLVKAIYGSDSVSLLSGITSPGGGVESVTWSAQATFAGLKPVSATPHVTTHIRQLKSGQVAGTITARYDYGRNIASAIIGTPFSPQGFYETACVTGDGSADGHVTVNYWKFNQDNMTAEQEAYDVILLNEDKGLGAFETLALIDNKTNYPSLIGQVSAQSYPTGGSPALARLAVNAKTTYITRISGKDHTRIETHTFTYDDQGNLKQEKRADGSQMDYTYYPAAGEIVNGIVNCPAEPLGLGFISCLKESTLTPRPSSYSAPTVVTRYFYQSVKIPGMFPVILLSRQQEYRGSIQLKQTSLAYNESGNFTGTLASSVETFYDSDGKTYPTTTKHDYSLTGRMLTVKNTLTTYDNLSVSSSANKSMDTGLIYAEADARGNTIEYTYDKLGRILTRVTNKGTAYACTDTLAYGIVGVNSTTGLPAPGGDTPYVGWVMGTSTRQPGVKNLTLTDAMGRMVGTWLIDPAHNNGQWILTEFIDMDTFSRPLKVTAYDLLIPARQIKNITNLKYTYTHGIVTTATDANHITHHSQERMVDRLNDNSQIVASSRNWISGTLGSTQRSATVVYWKDILGLVLRTEIHNEAGMVLNFTTQEYDGLNRLRKSTDELGRVTTFSYDVWDRVTTTTLPDGSQVARDYSPFSDEELTTGIGVTPSGMAKIPLGTQVFDGLGRNKQSVSGGRTYKWTFTGSNPVPATMTTPKLEILSYTTLPQLGDVLSTVKDGTGTMAGKNLSNSYNFDGKTGLMSDYSDISGRKTTNTYNSRGMLTKQTITSADGKQNKTATAGYSVCGRLLDKTDVTGAKTTYIYDGTGRLQHIQDKDVTTRLMYDALGRINEITQRPVSGNPVGLTTTLTFDEQGREKNRKLEYLILNRPLKQYIMTSDWFKNGQMKSRTLTQTTLGDLRNEQYTYDTRNRLKTYTCSGAEQPKDPAGNTIKQQTFTWDALDNLTQCNTVFQTAVLPNITGDRLVYTYDTTDRTQLRAMTHTNLIGDILDGDLLVTVLDYDVNGNLISDDQGRILSWNAVNQLKGIENTTLFPPQTRAVVLTQDATGTPATRQETITPLLGKPQTTTRDWYYEGRLQAEINSDGSLSRLTASNAQTDVAANGTRITSLSTSDGQQSPQLNVETEVWSNWGPFGDSPAPADADKTLAGYTREHRDPWTGNYYLGQRQYSPSMRHFTSPDSLSPFGVGGINAYAYCNGDPVNMMDPSGHDAYTTRSALGVPYHLASAGIDTKYRPVSFGDAALGLGILFGALAIIGGALTLGAASGALLAGAGFSMSILMAGGAGVTGIAGGALGIASAVSAESNPELSRRLGIAATVFDVLSLIELPLAAGRGTLKISSWISQKVAKRGIGAAIRSGKTVTLGGNMRELKSLDERYYTFVDYSDAFPGQNRLNITSHGAPGVLTSGGRSLNAAELSVELSDRGISFNNYADIRVLACHSAEGGGLFVYCSAEFYKQETCSGVFWYDDRQFFG